MSRHKLALIALLTISTLSVAQRGNNGTSGSGTGTGSVTNSGTLTSGKCMVGNGTTVVKVDGACSISAGVITTTGVIAAVDGIVGGNTPAAGHFTTVDATGSISSGTAPTACGSATGCFGATEASTAGTPTLAQSYFRFGSTAHDIKFSLNNGAEGPLPANSGGTASTFFTVLGPTAARSYTFPDAAATIASGTGTTGTLPKFTTGASGILGNSLLDDGVTTANSLTYTGTAGVRSPAFTGTGTTAGFADFPQGTTSAAVAPCNVATSICEQAPTSVTSYLLNKPGAAANGILRWANSANVVTSSVSELSGDCATSGSNAVVCTQVNGANFTVASTGLVTKDHALTTAGQGHPITLGFTSQKAETTSADANVLTVTPAAAVGSYCAHVVISVASATSGVISWTMSYADSNANAQTNIAQPLFQHGTAAPNTTFTTSAAGNYHGDSCIDVSNAATAIVIKWVGGGTTSAKMSAWIDRVN